MPSSPAFVLSESVQIELTDDAINITHDGDVVIEQALGRKLGVVKAGGDLTIRLESITGTLSAGGVLRLEGAIDADTLHGRDVHLGDDPVKCKAISAEAGIHIGAADLKVDAIIAPHIEVDGAASGRVTVIESHNERRPTKIKGGFSLADYGDMFGDADEFLATRGLKPLGAEGDAPAPVEPAPAAPRAKPRKAKPAPEPEAEAENIALAPTISEEEDDEDVDDPLSLSLDDLEPLVDGSSDDGGEVQTRLEDALKRITSCYEGADMPPAVKELRALIDDGDMNALRSNITEVWNGLLGFHQKRGIRPHHQVTHAFNVIHSLVS